MDVWKTKRDDYGNYNNQYTEESKFGGTIEHFHLGIPLLGLNTAEDGHDKYDVAAHDGEKVTHFGGHTHRVVVWQIEEYYALQAASKGEVT